MYTCTLYMYIHITNMPLPFVYGHAILKMNVPTKENMLVLHAITKLLGIIILHVYTYNVHGKILCV
jgi:hypothetical protein